MFRASLGPEEDSCFSAFFDSVVPDDIVRVAVPGADPMEAAPLDLVCFRNSIFHAPAPIDSCLAVGNRVGPHDGALRTAAWVKPEIGHVPDEALADFDVVRNLPANAIPVESVNRHVLYQRFFAIMEKYRAANVSIEVGIILPVAFQNEIFYGH